MKRFLYYYFIISVISVLLTAFALLATTVSLLANSGKEQFQQKLRDRLEVIILKEYSIKSLKGIWVGVVNYPQWFVSLSMGRFDGLTFNGKIRGSESIYPTNITQQRWMFNFNTSSKVNTETCSHKIKGWADDPNLELVMYSQMMNICLSSDWQLYKDDELWYQKCWLNYHKNCKFKG